MTTIEEGIALEREALKSFRSYCRENAHLLRFIAHWGDGRGGYLLQVVQEETGITFGDDTPPPRATKKQVIPRLLRKQVFERDAYRCRHCGGHVDLCADHVIPESKGGPTTLDNLQTLCRPCNSKKGARP